eukprot:COSAG04_NODE_1184_length_7885_cov_98.186874_7_plen_666_part_00
MLEAVATTDKENSGPPSSRAAQKRPPSALDGSSADGDDGREAKRRTSLGERTNGAEPAQDPLPREASPAPSAEPARAPPAAAVPTAPEPESELTKKAGAKRGRDEGAKPAPAEWSAREVEIFIAAHKRLGNAWTDIAELLPGRAPKFLQNAFSGAAKRKRPPKAAPPEGRPPKAAFQAYAKEASSAQAASRAARAEAARALLAAAPPAPEPAVELTGSFRCTAGLACAAGLEGCECTSQCAAASGAAASDSDMLKIVVQQREVFRDENSEPQRLGPWRSVWSEGYTGWYWCVALDAPAPVGRTVTACVLLRAHQDTGIGTSWQPEIEIKVPIATATGTWAPQGRTSLDREEIRNFKKAVTCYDLFRDIVHAVLPGLAEATLLRTWDELVAVNANFDSLNIIRNGAIKRLEERREQERQVHNAVYDAVASLVKEVERREKRENDNPGKLTEHHKPRVLRLVSHTTGAAEAPVVCELSGPLLKLLKGLGKIVAMAPGLKDELFLHQPDIFTKVDRLFKTLLDDLTYASLRQPEYVVVLEDTVREAFRQARGEDEGDLPREQLRAACKALEMHKRHNIESDAWLKRVVRLCTGSADSLGVTEAQFVQFWTRFEREEWCVALVDGMEPCVPVKRERAAEDRRAHIEGEQTREKKRRVAAASAQMPAQVV